MKTLLTMDEVAVAVGVTRQTVYNWYKFKKKNPDNDYVKLLPEPVQIGRQSFWNKSDINNMIRFKKSVPHGCKGIMGEITQRYYRKTGENNE